MGAFAGIMSTLGWMSILITLRVHFELSSTEQEKIFNKRKYMRKKDFNVEF